MKKFFKEIIETIKNNYFVAYSLLLVVVIPLVLVVGSYFSISQFEANFDHILQTKALLLENVVGTLAVEDGLDSGSLQRKIEKISVDNSEVSSLDILAKNQQDDYVVVASLDKSKIGQVSADFKDRLAEATTEGIASIEADQNSRYWEVVKGIETGEGQSVLIKSRISLEQVDAAFERSTQRVYIILGLTSLVLILLVTNYVRLSRFAMLYKKIKEVDKMKDDFVSMASHELKTPLTAISGYIDLITNNEKDALNENAKKYLENIRLSSERLKNLVGDILEVSRLEQDRIPFNPQKISVATVCEKAINGLRCQAEDKNLELTLVNQLEKGHDHIEVDPERFEQIIVNLVGNSIKYTLTGGIKVILGRERDRIKISVEDTGVGMNAKQLDKLFGKFYRAKNEKTLNVEGTGLGLWITRQLVEKMNGEIEVESMEGVGTKFILWFKTQE